MKNLFKSLLYTIAFSIMINIVMEDMFLVDFIKGMIKYGWVDDLKNKILMGLYLFFILYVVTIIIFFGIKSIWHMILFHYDILFYNKKEIHVTVDEDYIIRDSFVELSGGKIIPIKIKKIIMNKPDEQEEKEE